MNRKTKLAMAACALVILSISLLAYGARQRTQPAVSEPPPIELALDLDHDVRETDDAALDQDHDVREAAAVALDRDHDHDVRETAAAALDRDHDHDVRETDDAHDHDHDVRDLAYGNVPAQMIPPPTMTMLADGVYHYFGFFGSSLVVVDGGQVLITDPYNGLRAQSLKEEIAKITDNPVTEIALTHEHYDHVGGTRAFPGASVICHRNCAPQFALDTLGDVPEVDQTFDDALDVSVGGKTVSLRYLGHGDGEATTVVYMPEEKIVVTSDLYEPRALTHKNWVDDKNFTGVRHILNTISGWEIEHAVNAHSPGTNPRDMMENVEYYNDLYDAVYDALADAAREGGQQAMYAAFGSLPRTLELDEYKEWLNYDSSFPRHVERMMQAVIHAD